ncbi:Exopolyphosphatase [Onygenales sp. PD_40]|nr:Exopolyphosphatase [Onygenales sp. PD_40]
MTLPKPPRGGGLDLLRFLKHTSTTTSSSSPPLSSYLPSPSSSVHQPIYVLGNPSADLDSTISAIIYSYFASRFGTSSSTWPSTNAPGNGKCNKEEGGISFRQYIPLINLPDVPCGRELGRLRPEFVAALRLAVGWDGDGDRDEEELERSVLTVANLRERLKTSRSHGGGEEGLATATAALEGSGGVIGDDINTSARRSIDEQNLDIMLVDWNALPKLQTPSSSRSSLAESSANRQPTHGIQGISDTLPNIHLSIIGCIDHHADESFVPKETTQLLGPRCIQTGVGSCTSLVVRELRERGLWADNSSSPSSSGGESQAAKLALAAILIDTANMTAKSKVSPVDIAAVEFLEAKIRAAAAAIMDQVQNTNSSAWDRESFYTTISRAKEDSVNNLTVSEVLGRDYKEWTATSTAPEEKVIKMGICSVVKPLSWLLEKCTGEKSSPQSPKTATNNKEKEDPLFIHLTSFSTAQNLDVVAVMTAFRTTADDTFCRELLLYVLNPDCREGAERFEKVAVGELGLEEGGWGDGEEGDLRAGGGGGGGDGGSYKRVWRQMDVSKSRKEVAPLLRAAMGGERGGGRL